VNRSHTPRSGKTGTTLNIYDYDVIVCEDRTSVVSQSRSFRSRENTGVPVSHGFDLEYIWVGGCWGGGEERSSFAILTSGSRVTFPVADIYPENRSDSHDICESEGDRWMTRMYVI